MIRKETQKIKTPTKEYNNELNREPNLNSSNMSPPLAPFTAPSPPFAAARERGKGH
jgi:hypothetical protein